MKRVTRTVAICAALGLVGLTNVSCSSTPTAAEEPAPMGEATTTSVLSLPQPEAPAAEPQATSTDDSPYADRAVPFSEERVNALESSLKPLDSVPIPTGKKLEEPASDLTIEA